MTPLIVAEGMKIPEGPVWCDDGTVVCVAVVEGKLYRIWPEERRKAVLADPAGGPNAVVRTTGGGFVFTQNGGFDIAALGVPGDWPPLRRTDAGIQHVDADGVVRWLAVGMQAPNDLVVGSDGTLYFTDPHKYPVPPDSALSRVMAISPEGNLRVFTDGLHYCNGIACEPDGTIVVTEANGLMRLHADGRHEWIIESVSERHATDGFCVDVEGRFYLASEVDNGIRIIEDGREVDFLTIPGGGLTTNCCFGGLDNRTLFATDGLRGTLVMWVDMPTPGLAATEWVVPQALLSRPTSLSKGQIA